MDKRCSICNKRITERDERYFEAEDESFICLKCRIKNKKDTDEQISFCSYFDFFKAIMLLQEGYKCYRKTWNNTILSDSYIYINNDKIIKHNIDNTEHEWQATSEELLADNWIILDKENLNAILFHIPFTDIISRTKMQQTSFNTFKFIK